MPTAASSDPYDVERPARADDRHEQRAGELDRHRDGERDPGDRLVERPVHQPERDAERPGEPQVAGQPGAPDRPQHDRRERQSQERRTRRTKLIEQRHGQRCTDLRGNRRDDHEADGGRALPADGRPRATDVAVHALRSTWRSVLDGSGRVRTCGTLLMECLQAAARDAAS